MPSTAPFDHGARQFASTSGPLVMIRAFCGPAFTELAKSPVAEPPFHIASSEAALAPSTTTPAAAAATPRTFFDIIDPFAVEGVLAPWATVPGRGGHGRSGRSTRSPSARPNSLMNCGLSARREPRVSRVHQHPDMPTARVSAMRRHGPSAGSRPGTAGLESSADRVEVALV